MPQHYPDVKDVVGLGEMMKREENKDFMNELLRRQKSGSAEKKPAGGRSGGVGAANTARKRRIVGSIPSAGSPVTRKKRVADEISPLGERRYARKMPILSDGREKYIARSIDEARTKVESAKSRLSDEDSGECVAYAETLDSPSSDSLDSPVVSRPYLREPLPLRTYGKVSMGDKTLPTRPSQGGKTLRLHRSSVSSDEEPSAELSATFKAMLKSVEKGTALRSLAGKAIATIQRSDAQLDDGQHGTEEESIKPFRPPSLSHTPP